MYDHQLDYRAIQRRADYAVKRRQFRMRLGLFLANLFMFVAFILLGWAKIGGRGLYPEQFFFTTSLLSIGWFIGLVLQGASLWLSSERGTRRMQERIIARDIAAEVSRLGLDDRDAPLWDEKAKRRHLADEQGDHSDELVNFAVRDEWFREDTR